MRDCIADYDTYVRLSIRPSEDGDVSSKIGIASIYKSQGTPWHKVLALDKEGASLQSLKELTKNESAPSINYYDIDGMKLGYVNKENEN